MSVEAGGGSGGAQIAKIVLYEPAGDAMRYVGGDMKNSHAGTIE